MTLNWLKWPIQPIWFFFYKDICDQIHIFLSRWLCSQKWSYDLFDQNDTKMVKMTFTIKMTFFLQWDICDQNDIFYKNGINDLFDPNDFFSPKTFVTKMTFWAKIAKYSPLAKITLTLSNKILTKVWISEPSVMDYSQYASLKEGSFFGRSKPWQS